MYEDHPLVRLAISRVGGIEEALEDLPGFLEALGDIIEATAEYTQRLGLTVGQLLDLVSQVRAAELDYSEGTGQSVTTATAPDTKKVVAELWLRGVEPDTISLLCGLERSSVTTILDGRHGHSTEREVVQLHFRGHTPVEIAQTLGIGRYQAARTIERINEPPHTTRACGLSELRQRIIKLRKDGKSYGEIRDLTGARVNQIRNAIRWGMAKGLLPRDCNQALAATGA